MEAHDILLQPLLEGAKQFIIPVFQRDYRWSESQCDQLWRDVVRVGSNSRAQVHFIGSVVYIAAEDSTADVPRWLLIDGQQRLTTISLMIIALRDHIRAMSNDALPLPEQLEHQFLRNQYARGDRRQKLQLRRKDDATLQWLIDRIEEENGKPSLVSDRIVENYQDFRERLKTEDAKVVYEGLLKLKLVHVILLRGQDDPQMIFESLNSTGLDLTPGDLVRNYVLMRQEERLQTELYQARWRPIEEAFGNAYATNFDAFLNHYLVIHTRQNKPVKADEVYPQFKAYFTDATGERSVEAELSELGRFAKYYVRYSLGKEPNERLRAAFAKLRSQVDVAAPVVMRLYDMHETSGALDARAFAEAVELLESYVFRRSICGMQTRGLGTIMSTLTNRLKAGDPLLSLKVALKQRGHNQSYPTDAEFLTALLTRDLYHMDNCNTLLVRLENHDTKEPSNTKGLTIEHVMPQNPDMSKEWKEMLGADWQTVHEEWLHKLGNLTLTAYNSEYSDEPFAVKKTMDHGFNDSPLRLNKMLRERSSWTKADMEERAKLWAPKALIEWPPLVVAEKDVKRAVLEDLQERSAKYNESTLKLSEHATALYRELRTALLALGNDVVEVFHSKGVTFRCFEYVVEVLPRARRLALLFPLDFAECDDPSGLATNMEDRSFIANATESGGVLFKLDELDQIPAAVYIAKQAYEKGMV